jgi:hypothetical protein
MKRFVQLVLVLLMASNFTATQALATSRLFRKGTQSGGGTDVYPGASATAEDDVLVDFAGQETAVVIDPRLFEGIYASVAGKLDRIDYYHPGLKAALEKVFDKEWRVTNRTFQAVRRGEQRPIEQNERTVEINNDWIRTATPELKGQAWIHEMVRGFIEDEYVRRTIENRELWPQEYADLPDEDEILWLSDEAVRTITPLIYNEVRRDHFMADFVDAFRSNISDPLKYKNAYYMGTRERMYNMIAESSVRLRYETFCAPDLLNNRRAMIAALEQAKRHRRDYYSESLLDYLQPEKSGSAKFLKDYARGMYEWQTRMTDFKNIFSSDQMTGVALFSVMISGAMENEIADGLYGYAEVRGSRILPLTEAKRVLIVKDACGRWGEQVSKSLQEYDQDGGRVRDLPPGTVPATTQQDVDRVLRP